MSASELWHVQDSRSDFLFAGLLRLVNGISFRNGINDGRILFMNEKDYDPEIVKSCYKDIRDLVNDIIEVIKLRYTKDMECQHEQCGMLRYDILLDKIEHEQSDKSVREFLHTPLPKQAEELRTTILYLLKKNGITYQPAA